jgi:hypothetical protein
MLLGPSLRKALGTRSCIKIMCATGKVACTEASEFLDVVLWVLEKLPTTITVLRKDTDGSPSLFVNIDKL